MTCPSNLHAPMSRSYSRAHSVLHTRLRVDLTRRCVSSTNRCMGPLSRHSTSIHHPPRSSSSFTSSWPSASPTSLTLLFLGPFTLFFWLVFLFCNVVVVVFLFCNLFMLLFIKPNSFRLQTLRVTSHPNDTQYCPLLAHPNQTS